MKRILIFIGLKIKEITTYLFIVTLTVGCSAGAFIGSMFLASWLTDDRSLKITLTLTFPIVAIAIPMLILYWSDLRQWLSDNWREAGRIAGKLIIVLALLGMVGCSSIRPAKKEYYIKVEPFEVDCSSGVTLPGRF